MAVKKETNVIVNDEPEKDVTEGRVKIMLPRARPGEETDVFVSNGRVNVLVKKGVEVEVPYWVWDRLRQKQAAEEVAYRYEMATEKRAEAL